MQMPRQTAELARGDTVSRSQFDEHAFERRAKKATPGKWALERDLCTEDDPDDAEGTIERIGPFAHFDHDAALDGRGEQLEADALFLETAREDALEACAEIKMLRVKLARVNGTLAGMRDRATMKKGGAS
jgi:hypothetical protein